MEDLPLKTDISFNEDCKQYVFLTKDWKPICRTLCLNPPENLPPCWNIHDVVKRSELTIYPDAFYLCPVAECRRDQNEWKTFLTYLLNWNKVAIAKLTTWQFYILPPERTTTAVLELHISRGKHPMRIVVRIIAKKVQYNATFTFELVRQNMDPEENSKSNDERSGCDPTKRHQSSREKRDAPSVKNYVRADPGCLEALGQAHSGWIFGAIAELVDNARDAQATRLDISIESVYSKRVGKSIPMLSIIDDGCGMNLQEIVRMVCLGHKKPDKDDVDRIG